MSRACQTGAPPWHAVGSEYFEITAEIVETTTDVVEAVEQCTEFRARSGACEIEVERELEVTSGDGAALKFHEVDIQGVDAFQHAIQAPGSLLSVSWMDVLLAPGYTAAPAR